MTLGRSEVFTAADPGWSDLLAQVPHDVFHRPNYHLLTGFGQSGIPYLFSYRESGSGVFAWPYLKNAIPGTGYHDVSSVYGYAGPLGHGDPEFLGRAWSALSDHWKMQNVVAAFTRFHPMMGNASLIDKIAADGLSGCGTTVSIDLRVPSEVQTGLYRKILRHDIRKARQLGFVTTEDTEWSDAGSFVRLYRETMARKNSRSEYLLDEAWLGRFREALGPHARLFVTRWQGTVAGALLAIEYAPFLHMHLTGINADLTAYSPLKILLDDIREWATQRGLQTFHLGGGLGGREDSLFEFKRRFSPITHTFRTGRWVLNREVYGELAENHRASLIERGCSTDLPDYFPIYRYQPAPMTV